MSFSEIVRERSVACVWCRKPTWALNAVCKSRHCRQLEDRYKVRRGSTSSAGVSREGAATTPRFAPGPGTSPHAFDESACAGEAGAASSGEGRGLLSARTPVCPSPVSDRG